MRTITLDVPEWPGHVAGQHVDVRLGVADGPVVRSYAVASAAGGPVELTVQKAAGGELSPYLVGQLTTGESVEVLGPMGARFTWRPGAGEPVQLIAEGIGIVPLAAMLRTRWLQRDTTPMRLLYVSDRAGLIFASELDLLLSWPRGTRATRSRSPRMSIVQPPERLDTTLLAAHSWPSTLVPTVYLCGSSQFVDRTARSLGEQGHDSTRIRTQRFGPC